MADFVTLAVQRLRQDPGFSRNRHTLALSSPEGRRALRIHRHLRSLERELAAGVPATVTREAWEDGQIIQVQALERFLRCFVLQPVEDPLRHVVAVR